MANFRNDLDYIFVKSNWHKNWSRLTTRSDVCSWIGLINNLKMIRIFIKKSSSAMGLISGWMANVNKQNMRYWSDSNPHVLHDSSLHHWAVLLPWWSRPARYCEWESLSFNDNRIFLAPIEWYGLGGHVVPTGRRHKPQSECYNQFIGNQVWRTCHLTKCSVGWPSQSCNLTPLDYFLLGYVKSGVYANKPATRS